ncbi:MAG: hypothetical protein AYK23_00035 [Candidatus Proteinoplasmatales archaeon SG8-5]|nr:MAG: hypothetical protein AYK23_00035 [Candidatus Proteinoplasmatales archaeon SG8-5]
MIEAILTICLVFLFPNLVLAIWTYFDCVNRGAAEKSALRVALWFIVVWAIPLLGIIIYIAFRPKGKLLTCATCKRKVLKTLPKCPHCDASATPQQPPRTYPIPAPQPVLQPAPPPPKTINCPHCAKKVEEEWKSCPHCGKKLRVERAIIDEVFLMSRDGRLIKHFTRRLKPDVDQDILSGMLTAVQDFVKDSFRGEGGELDQMKFGRFQVLIGRGRFITIAAVVIGEEIEPFRPQISKAIDEIEDDYEVLLRDWKGDVGELNVLSRYINDLIDGRYT